VLLDQYGPLRLDKDVFPEARDCVAALRARGKTIIVLSNSGKRSADNVTRLAKVGLSAEAYDGLLSSGEVTWRGLRDRKSIPFTQVGRRCFVISRDADRGVVGRPECSDALRQPGPNDVHAVRPASGTRRAGAIL
jgi:ribonucleotide monophosphatase NagD (HAD superfamily)